MVKVTCNIKGDKSRVTSKRMENCQFLGVIALREIYLWQNLRKLKLMKEKWLEFHDWSTHIDVNISPKEKLIKGAEKICKISN